MSARALPQTLRPLAIGSCSKSCPQATLFRLSARRASTLPAFSFPTARVRAKDDWTISSRKQQQRGYSLWPFGWPGASKDTSVSSTAPEIPETNTTNPSSSTLSTSPEQAAPAEAASTHDLASSVPHGSQEATEQASQALEAGQHLLADFGQGQTWFVGNIQKLLVGVHDVTGLPWWISIPVTILSIRLLLLYPVGKLLAHSHRFSQVQPQIAELAGEMKSANARKDFIAIQNTQTRMQSLFAKHNVNPMKLFALPVLQAPIFIGLFFALKRLANAGWPDFQTGGLAWFTDLTVADPTYILPLVSSLATLTTFELGADFGAQQAQPPHIRWAFRGILVFSFYFISNLPAAVFVYWVTQNLLSLAQLFLIRTPYFRSIFGMPAIEKSKPSAPAQPSMPFTEGLRTGFQLGTDPTPPASSQAPSKMAQSASSAPRALPTQSTDRGSFLARLSSSKQKDSAASDLPTNAAFAARPARAGIGKGKSKNQNSKKAKR